MKKQVSIILLTLIACMLPMNTSAKVSQAKAAAIIDSLRSCLRKCDNPADSLSILYNLFDISPRKDRAIIGEQIYQVSVNAKNNETAFDILRNLANIYLGNDSLQTVLIDRTKSFPDCPERRETESFIKLSRCATRAQKLPEKERQKHLLKLLSEYTSSNHDITLNSKIEQLFKVCIFLGASSQSGTLLCGYMDELGRLIDQLPEGYSPLRNMYYVQADIIYGNSNQPEKAIMAGEKLLDIINDLENYYHRNGRVYKNYDTYYYLIYRRFLSNYRLLSKNDVEKYYKSILSLAKDNSDIAIDLKDNERADIYYLMATRRYDDALSILKRQINNPNQSSRLTNLLKLMLIAADSVGDQSAIMTSSLKLNEMLQEYIELNANEHYNELKILYDINKIKAQNIDMEREHNASKTRWHMSITIMSVFIVLALLVLVTYLFKSSRKAKRLANDLRLSNKALTEESCNLRKTQQALIEARNQARSADKQKTDFIHNMSHEIQTPLNTIVEYSQLLVDFVDEDKRQYLQKYSQVILLSCDLLKTLIDDVFDIAAIENGRMSVCRQAVSMSEMCTMPLESVKKRLHPGVKIIYETSDNPLPLITTDRARVEQVLINMLNNAAKFTQHGTITLSCGLNSDKSMAIFTVCDTGPGIPIGKENIIFDRFEKLDPETPGGGLGLHICKLVAKLLGGDIKVDSSYRQGAKFVFTIPSR